MAQQSASASPLRDSEDKKGLGQNRKGQTHTRQDARGAQGKAAYAGRPVKPLEKKPYRAWGQVGEKADWEVRCAELGQDEWLGIRGPIDNWRMVCVFAENIDHDAARPIAFGKRVTVEIRPKGSSEAQAFEVTGRISFDYHARRVAS